MNIVYLKEQIINMLYKNSSPCAESTASIKFDISDIINKSSFVNADNIDVEYDDNVPNNVKVAHKINLILKNSGLFSSSNASTKVLSKKLICEICDGKNGFVPKKIRENSPNKNWLIIKDAVSSKSDIKKVAIDLDNTEKLHMILNILENIMFTPEVMSSLKNKGLSLLDIIDNESFENYDIEDVSKTIDNLPDRYLLRVKKIIAIITAVIALIAGVSALIANYS